MNFVYNHGAANYGASNLDLASCSFPMNQDPLPYMKNEPISPSTKLDTYNFGHNAASAVSSFNPYIPQSAAKTQSTNTYSSTNWDPGQMQNADWTKSDTNDIQATTLMGYNRPFESTNMLDTEANERDLVIDETPNSSQEEFIKVDGASDSSDHTSPLSMSPVQNSMQCLQKPKEQFVKAVQISDGKVRSITSEGKPAYCLTFDKGHI